MLHNVPAPDNPLTGIIEVDSGFVRPVDEIRIRDNESGGVKKTYSVLSILDDSEAQMYEKESEEFILMDEAEVDELLDRPDSYHWAILNRAMAPIQDDPVDMLVFWLYAFEHKFAGDRRALCFCWSITEQRPVENMPDLDEFVLAPNFTELNKMVEPGESEEFDELYDTLSGDVHEAVEQVSMVGEYNANQMFQTYEEPTYDERIEELLEEDAVSIAEVEELTQSLYN